MSRLCRTKDHAARIAADRRHVGAVFLDVIEQVPVEIERHPYGGVAITVCRRLGDHFKYWSSVAEGMEAVA